MEDEIISEFTSIKGIDESMAKALYEAGYTSVRDLNNATVEELSRINDITDQLAEEIKNEVSQIYEDFEAGEVVGESGQEEGRTVSVEAEDDFTEFEDKAVEEIEAEVVEEIEAETVEEIEAEAVEEIEAEAVEEIEAEAVEEIEAEVVEEIEAEVVGEIEAEVVGEIEAVPVTELELDPRSQRLLKVRRKQKAKKPKFVQTDQHKKKRLKKYWRRPRGLHNKKRRHILGKGEIARVGYGSPSAVKGLHPSGFQDVMMYRVQDLAELDPGTQAVRISRTVGQRKRMEIVNKARSLGLKILNPPIETVPEEEEVQ